MRKCSFLSVGCFSFLVIRLFASPLPLPVRSLPCCFSSYLPHMFLVPCFSGSVTLSNFSRSLLFALQILPFSLSSFFHVFSFFFYSSDSPSSSFSRGFFWHPLFQDLIGVVPALKPLCFSNDYNFTSFLSSSSIVRNTFSFCCFTTFSLSNVPFLFSCFVFIVVFLLPPSS